VKTAFIVNSSCMGGSDGESRAVPFVESILKGTVGLCWARGF
jgi:hypothetical protein